MYSKNSLPYLGLPHWLQHFQVVLFLRLLVTIIDVSTYMTTHSSSSRILSKSNQQCCLPVIFFSRSFFLRTITIIRVGILLISSQLASLVLFMVLCFNFAGRVRKSAMSLNARYAGFEKKKLPRKVSLASNPQSCFNF